MLLNNSTCCINLLFDEVGLCIVSPGSKQPNFLSSEVLVSTRRKGTKRESGEVITRVQSWPAVDLSPYEHCDFILCSYRHSHIYMAATPASIVLLLSMIFHWLSVDHADWVVPLPVLERKKAHNPECAFFIIPPVHAGLSETFGLSWHPFYVGNHPSVYYFSFWCTSYIVSFPLEVIGISSNQCSVFLMTIHVDKFFFKWVQDQLWEWV